MILVSTQQPDGRPGNGIQRYTRLARLMAKLVSLPESLHTAHVARLQFFCDRLLKVLISCVLVWLLPRTLQRKRKLLR